MDNRRKSTQRTLGGAVGAALVAIAAAAPAQAQGLGGLPGAPGLPGAGAIGPLLRESAVRGPAGADQVGALDPVGAALRGAPDLAGVPLNELRRLRIRALVRDNARFVETDAAGEPVVRGQVLAIAPSAHALAAATAAGFSVAERTQVAVLGLEVVTLSAPAGLSARQAVRRLRTLDPEGDYDFNHIYLEAGQTGAAGAHPPDSSAAAAPARLGLIDGGVEARHPSLAQVRVQQRGFAPGGPRASAHGQAVAALLAGRQGRFSGAAPGASLFVADVYGDSPTGGSAVLLVQALAWMAENRVPVINVSLVGPANRTVEAVVKGMADHGHLIVAAVGNDGPSAPPLYPAAYPGVVAVTGVDDRRRALLEAGRGGHVDFAAPGTDMAAPAPQGGFVQVRGTSFAAPLVAGRLARRLAAPDPVAAARALTALQAEADDLGRRGRDRTYGDGLVAFDLRTPPERVSARADLQATR